MSKGLKAAAAKLGSHLSTIESIILSEDVVFTPISTSTSTGIDVASWTAGGKTLVLGGNMGTKSASKSFEVPSRSGGEGSTLFSLGAKASASSGAITVDFDKYGSIGLLIS